MHGHQRTVSDVSTFYEAFFRVCASYIIDIQHIIFTREKSFCKTSFHLRIAGAEKRQKQARDERTQENYRSSAKISQQMSCSLLAFFHLCLVSVLFSAQSILKWNEVLQKLFSLVYNYYRVKSCCNTSFQLRTGMKNVQKQGRNERMQEGYPIHLQKHTADVGYSILACFPLCLVSIYTSFSSSFNWNDVLQELFP